LFERPHHQRIARVLEALDGPLLERHGCFFGGGTAIALRFGEFRESVDIDFLVSDPDGYRGLRTLVTGPAGVGSVVRFAPDLQTIRDLRADQYGLRTLLRVDGSEVKLEIVREARIVLESPIAADRVCGIASLTTGDLLASKLLANSDRWADDGAFSRDLIDLAMMAPGRSLLDASLVKARAAYGASIDRDLDRAIIRLRERDHRLERCLDALSMTVPRALVWQRIRILARAVAPKPPSR
jgi:hypothetical protein